jgi:formylglycine-generating enzyme required for sulfatase activity
MDVSWDDAKAYVAWLSRKTGKAYRLPSEAEWEYAARGGTRTRFWWGDDVGRNNANCESCGSRWDKERAAPVGSFAPSAFGLHDMHGNVEEWVEDCWNDDHRGAPTDGAARTGGDCWKRVLRGGSYYDPPGELRSAHRRAGSIEVRAFTIGFRVARSP